MLNLANKPFVQVAKRGIIYIDDEKYFCKRDYKGYPGAELICEGLAKLAGINCAHYERVIAEDDKSYYLSLDLNCLGKFLTAYDLGLIYNDCSLYRIIDFLKRLDSTWANTLKEDIIRIYLFDIFIMNSDRHSDNWGVLTYQDGSKRIFVLDNNEAFDVSTWTHITLKFDYAFYNPDCIDDAAIKVNMKNLDLFLKLFCDEYHTILLDMYNALTPAALAKVYEEIAAKLGYTLSLKDYVISIYEENYREIGRMLKTYGLIDDAKLERTK